MTAHASLVPPFSGAAAADLTANAASAAALPPPRTGMRVLDSTLLVRAVMNEERKEEKNHDVALPMEHEFACE